MASRLLIFLLLALADHEQGEDSRALRSTSSMSLLQATSVRSRTFEGEENVSEALPKPFGGPWQHVVSRALFQTSLLTSRHVVQEAKTSSVGATLGFLLLIVLLLSLSVAFVVSRPERKEPRETLKKDHLQLPGEALSRPRGSAAFSVSPVKGRSPRRSPSAASDEGSAAFCPDLVVPKGCECVLLVPIVPLSLGAFSVCDPNGHVVLKVTPKSLVERSSRPRKSVSFGETLGSSWSIELSTGAGELLAQSGICKTGKTPSSHPAFALMRADGAQFALLERNQQEGYELNTPDRIIYFWGSFDHHAVNITDEGGKLLATTELCRADWYATGEYYRLRVAPLVDVGLLLCSLVCIDQVAELGRRT